MKPIEVYNCQWFPGSFFLGWTAFPFIFYKNPKWDVSEKLRQHEMYHWKMQKRWFVLPRWIGWVILLCFYGYWEHPWEIAAREYADQNS